MLVSSFLRKIWTKENKLHNFIFPENKIYGKWEADGVLRKILTFPTVIEVTKI